MAKVADIQAQLRAVAGGTLPTPAAPAKSETAPRRATPPVAKAQSREGKVHIGAYLPADFKRSLMRVRAETGEDVQTLLARALNDLFRNHNVPVVDAE